MLATYDPLSLPPRRFHPGACGVCLSTKHLKPCTRCYLISYCSELHRQLDAEYHAPLCGICSTVGSRRGTRGRRKEDRMTQTARSVPPGQMPVESRRSDSSDNGKPDAAPSSPDLRPKLLTATGQEQSHFRIKDTAAAFKGGGVGDAVNTEQQQPQLVSHEDDSDGDMPGVYGKTVFFELGLDSKYVDHPLELLKWKDKLIFEMGCLLYRTLDAFEMQMILFPKLCSICLSDLPEDLEACSNCHSVFFCRLHQDALSRHQQETCFNLQSQPCQHLLPNSHTSKLDDKATVGCRVVQLKQGDGSLSTKSRDDDRGSREDSSACHDASSGRSLCSLLRTALECDRKEQLLGIENVDTIVSPYFSQTSNQRQIMNPKAARGGTLQWMIEFFGLLVHPPIPTPVDNQSGPDGAAHVVEIPTQASLPKSSGNSKVQSTQCSSVPAVSEISQLLLSDPLSFPLTLVHAVHMLRDQVQWKPRHPNKLVLHIVGAEAHRELLGLTRWEIVLHELPITQVEFVFIGTALECDLDEGKVEGDDGEIDHPSTKEETGTDTFVAGTAAERGGAGGVGHESDDAGDQTSIPLHSHQPPRSSLLYYQQKFGRWDRDRCYLSIDGNEELSCHACRRNQKQAIYRVFPCMGYEEFVDYWAHRQRTEDKREKPEVGKTEDEDLSCPFCLGQRVVSPCFVSPDLVIAFNCGFHVRTDDVEVWDPRAMKCLVLNQPSWCRQHGENDDTESLSQMDRDCRVEHAPLLFTSLSLAESQQDLDFLQTTLYQQGVDQISVLSSPKPNPYSSLRIVRDASGGDSPTRPTIYVANSAACMVWCMPPPR